MQTATPNGVNALYELFAGNLPLEAQGKALLFSEFLFNCFSNKAYQLKCKKEIDISQVEMAIDGGRQFAGLEFISYADIFKDVEQAVQSGTGRDSSVRRALMDSGLIDVRSVFFYPGTVLNGYSKKFWPKICLALQQALVSEESISDKNGNTAYYWYDALKIFSHYLDLLFDNARKAEIANCEKIMGVLPFCIPLGWAQRSFSRFIVLCK